jgi:hypothetical protein
MPKPEKTPPATIDETLAPLRNFTITTADRVRAAHGPPAYVRRKRHIEDLQASLAASASEAIEATGSVDAARRALEGSAALQKSLAELNRLIETHNRYYPIEANLPLDPTRRVQLDRGGRPYKPLQTMTLDDVFVAACGAQSPVGKIP